MDGDFAKSLKGKLDPEQYDICVNKGTEPAFTGKYHDSKELGTYRCVCCNVVLFKSDKKFNSGTGWPSFSDVIDKFSRIKSRTLKRCPLAIKYSNYAGP